MHRSKSATRAQSGHIVICGLDPLGVRVVQELRRLEEDVVVIFDEARPDRLAAVTEAGASLVRGQYRDNGTLRQANVQHARAIALVEQHDVDNLHAGLAAQEINPTIRVVMRLFSESLSRSVTALLHDCVAISASGIAAPLFVSVALGEGEARPLHIGGRRLALTETREGSSPGNVLLPLASAPDGGTPKLLPDGPFTSGLALIDATNTASTALPGAIASHRRGVLRRLWAAIAAVATIVDVRLRWLLVAVTIVVVASIVVFTLFDQLSVLDALYFTITTITTTGYGDITVLHAPLGVKIFGIALVMVGATALTVFYALLIDALIGVRLTRALGGMRGRMRDHVVVCGLGNVGLKVVLELTERDIPVVVVERDETSTNLAVARRLGVPVVLADASREESLRSSGIAHASCLIAVTNDDVTNLEGGLNARHLHPELRVVLRLFDDDLAARVDRAFGLSISRSVSAMAAPAFVAAILDRQVLSVIPVGRQVLLVAEVTIEPGSALDGCEVSMLEGPGAIRALCSRAGDGSVTWTPPPGAHLAAGDTLTCVTTRAGLSLLLAQARNKMEGTEPIEGTGPPSTDPLLP